MSVIENSQVSEQVREVYMTGEYNQRQEEFVYSVRKAAGAVLSFAQRAVGFFPATAPDSMSEHFDHAEKRNDPTPSLEYYRT